MGNYGSTYPDASDAEKEDGQQERLVENPIDFSK